MLSRRIAWSSSGLINQLIKRTTQTKTNGSSNNTAEPTIKLNDNCVKRLRQIQSVEFPYLRLQVDGGGCSGFQYRFTLDSTMSADEDIVFAQEDVKVVVDKVSLDFLKGSTIDYGEELIKSSFRVLNNPKAETGCSCGASFSVTGM